MDAASPLRTRGGPLAPAVILAALALAAPPAHAQFGTDLRLTGPPDVVSTTARNDAWSVATDDDDNIHTVYFDTRDAGIGDIAPYYRRFDRALNTWGPEVRVPAFPSANTRYVAIAVDCEGQAYVAWVHTQPGDQHYLFVRKRDANGVWGSDLLMQSRPTVSWDVRDPTLAADYLGNVYVLWAEGLKNAQGNHVYNVLYRVYDVSSDFWAGPFGVTNYNANLDPAPGARGPSVAAHHRLFGSGGIAHVAWADYVTGVVRYRALRHIPFNQPSLRGTVSLPMGGGVAPPSVAVRCGDVHVAWADPGSGTVFHRQGEMTFTSAETTAFVPAVPTGLTGQSPSIAVDGLGNVELAMVSGSAVAESHRSFMSGLWSPPQPVSDPAGVAADPTIAIDTHGAVHVVWSDTRNLPPGAGGAYYDRGGCLAAAAPALAAATAPQVMLDPELLLARAAAGPGERLPVLIAFRDRVDATALRREVAGLAAAERRSRVVRTLRAAAAVTQARALAELASAQRDGLAGGVRSLWSAGAVAAKVAPAVIDRLAALPEVEAIVFDPPRPMLEAEDTPVRVDPPPRTAGSSPAWSVSWIGAPSVWSQGFLGGCALVAIVDTGVDWTHPDLASRIWVNADEVPGNLVDDDGNGVVDDIHGFDSADDDGVPMDENGHGTHVGGSVAGDGTDGTITGVAPAARLMAIKVLQANGSGTFADIMDGVEYAVENGAQVLNLSLGGLCTLPETRALLRTNADVVAAAGVTMCVASANDRCKQRPPNMVRSPGDVPPPWLSPDQPPLGALGGVTTVGATGFMVDAITHFSSPGPVDWSQPPGSGDWLLCDPGTPNVGLIKPDVSAPGEDVLSTLMGGGYGVGSGTSMATPHVAGLAALMLSKNPQLTSDMVHEILENTALDLGPTGKDNDYGAGRVRAPEALTATPVAWGPPMWVMSHTVLDTFPPADGDGRLEPGETADIRLTFYNGGPFLLGNVTGALADDSPHVTIIDGASAFGDIPPGAQQDNAADPWRVSIAPGAPSGAPIVFSVTVTSYGACAVVAFADTIQSPVVGVDPAAVPRLPALALADVTPNPAGASAGLEFTLGTAGPVRLALYDVRGRLVRTLVDGTRDAGVHRETWDGRDLRGGAAAAGIYLVSIEAAGHRAQRKFIWLGR